MTLARRAPREVYRVYSEEEFFAVHEEEPFDGAKSVKTTFESTVPSGGGERRLRRMAGVAALAGAVGAVGATIAVTGSRSARGAGRRTVAGSHATADTRIATRVSAAADPRAAAAAQPPRLPRAVAGLPRSRGEHRHGALSRDGVRRWHAEDARKDAALTPRAAPDPVSAGSSTPPVDVARLTASRTAETTRPQHAEFGFER